MPFFYLCAHFTKKQHNIDEKKQLSTITYFLLITGCQKDPVVDEKEENLLGKIHLTGKEDYKPEVSSYILQDDEPENVLFNEAERSFKYKEEDVTPQNYPAICRYSQTSNLGEAMSTYGLAMDLIGIHYKNVFIRCTTTFLPPYYSSFFSSLLRLYELYNWSSLSCTTRTVLVGIIKNKGSKMTKL